MIETYYKMHGWGKDRFPRLYRFFFTYRRVVKYLASGGMAALVDLALLFALTEWVRLYYILSAALAFIIAFMVSFTLQKFWTFGDHDTEEIGRQAFLYFTVSFANLIINTALMYIFVEYVHLFYMLSQIIAGLLIAISSFFIYRRFIFHRPL